jgi:hypothetical protein
MIADPTGFTVSIFVLEADRKLCLAIAAKTHAQANQFCTDERVRVSPRGFAVRRLFDPRVRMARPAERAI